MTINRLDDHFDQAGAWDVLSAARGNLAFDIGANIGQSTKVLARGFDTVIALEPCLESYEILATECPDNVAPIWAAAWSHGGGVALTETFYSITTGQLTNGTGLGWGEVVGKRVVISVTLDDLAEHYGPPDFVKIDTEGSEVEILAGAQRLFADIRPAVIVEVHRADNEKLVRDLLPGYSLTKLTHEDRVGHYFQQNHFWLTGEAT